MSYCLREPTKAILADAPTLRQIATERGHGEAAYYIQTLLTAVFGLSNAKDPTTASTLRFAADSFAATFAPYKVTEILTFFGMYRAGYFNESYSTFDTRQIGIAFRKFLDYRREILDKEERRKAVEDIDARRFTPPAGYTSLTWYLHLKDLADHGDAEAAKQLKPPTQ